MDYAWSYATQLQKPVTVVLGNHEFYGQELYSYLADCRKVASQHSDIYLLENDCVILSGVRFFGCTLWTDFKLDGAPQTSMHEALISISDYRVIGLLETEGDEQALRPRHTARFNDRSREYLQRQLNQNFDGATVVVTHFPPTFMCAPQYEGDCLSPYFNNAWETSIQDGTLSPDLWICGHTHYRAEKIIGKTRVISNPGGYPRELEPFRWQVIEV